MTGHAFPIYSVFADEIPAVRTGQAIIQTHEYLACVDTTRRQPVWVAYTVSHPDYMTDNVLSRNFTTPKQFRPISLESSDYDGAEWADRGHCVALATKAASRHAAEVNWMPVISIHSKAANRGPIAKLELAIRKLAETGRVEVLYANLFEGNPNKLPNSDEEHEAPSHYCYLVKCKDAAEVAYLIPWDCEQPAGINEFVVEPQQLKERISDNWWTSK